MKIYTRKGDQGETSLLGGTRVPKHHRRIEAYGTVDELNAWIGLLRDQPGAGQRVQDLLRIQDRLFVIGSRLAVDDTHTQVKVPKLDPHDIVFLEERIDAMENLLPEMKNFVLPGGHPAVSNCHIARCVCRRAERQVTWLAESSGVEPAILQYLNRLSDFLFVLARWFSQELKVTEIPWKPPVS
jgi:cob(I)alamin adenosyltransferase